MLGFSMFKMWIVVALLAAVASAYGAHKFIVGQKDSVISEQGIRITELVTENSALTVAKKTQDNTIATLEQETKKQQVSIHELTTKSQQYEKERDAAQAIFDGHNFTLLARAKPELIERRINSATQKVFNKIESDSTELWDLLDTNYEVSPPPPSSPNNN